MSIEGEVWQRYELFAKPLPTDIIWKDERRDRTILALNTWKRINDNRDDYFDPEDKPESNASHPDVPEGSTLDSIKDPKLKKEYRELLKKNRQKSEYYKMQSHIKKHEAEYKRNASEYIIMLYSRPPKALDEISDLLEKHLVRRDLINELLITINATW